ncbi:MAG: DNA methyltransferase, partial [Candidatus Methylomirabilia bacterium]
MFRAILLGCLKPAGTDIMAEFYKDHSNDPDTVSKLILDPFMGGGTTVVEALRLGCKVIGIDLNPVAWFIVKTEVERVDPDELRAAFDRLANRPVVWSGKSGRETLLEQYKTSCPCCGSSDADIIYTFWVKSAICTNPAPPCERKTLVPLFSDYVIAQKSPSIRYWRDARCPRCDRTFDWEVEPATLIGEPDFMISSPTYSAGVGRTTSRWAYSSENTVQCPWCREKVRPLPVKARLERKKVPLNVLLCPFCEAAWQWRGELPQEVTCPVCHHGYNPKQGNLPKDGWFLCGICGQPDRVIHSIRQLPDHQLLPIHPYAIQGYCARCAGGAADDDEEEESDLLGPRRQPKRKKPFPDHPCWLTKSSGKFFTRVRPADLARYQAASGRWEREKDRLPYPKSEIPLGEKTKSGLIAHHYRYWHQIFTPRQLLCLSTLLDGVFQERSETVRDFLLCCFSMTLDTNDVFTRSRASRNTPGGTAPGGIFSRHDFQPKSTFIEQSVWGAPTSGTNTFVRRIAMIESGLRYRDNPYDGQETCNVSGGRDPIKGVPDLRCESANPIPSDLTTIDLVVTDPPYGGNVNYSELADFFYVWLRLGLANRWKWFTPEYCPKVEEIVVNPTRGQKSVDFEQGLKGVFGSIRSRLKYDGLLVFTFHHREGGAWELLLRALCEAGYIVGAVFPVQGEAENAMPIMGGANITYDLIHVCRIRDLKETAESRSWAGIRQEVRRRAREEIRIIEAGRYGRGLSPTDINLILIGKCLELYSRHYGAIVDHEDNVLELRDALKEIKNLVDQLVAKDQPLPSELEDIDPESRIYLLNLCNRKEIKGDEVHKATRGVL